MRPGAKRKRKLLVSLTSVGYTRAEMEETLRTLLALTLNELEHVCLNSHSTALEVTIARAIKDNAAKGNLAALEGLLLRLFGKPGLPDAAAVTDDDVINQPIIIQPALHVPGR